MKLSFFAAVFFGLIHNAWGQPAGNGGPPQEAVAACAGVSAGAACEFQAPRGRVSGRCRALREGRASCVPDVRGGMPRRDDRPPPSANRPSPMSVDIAGSNPAARRSRSALPDTRQGTCFNDDGPISCAGEGREHVGQDADYEGAQPAYRDNHDGTVLDLVTGLTWEQTHHDTRLDFYQATNACARLDLGGFSDWRLPNIKELFSLADFRGAQGRRPYIDDVFELREPGEEVLEGDRFVATHQTRMMGQTWSATKYTGVHFGRPGVEAAFFFNFLDGHIKQAPTRGNSKLFYRCVRGPQWGSNRFVDRGDGRVDDLNSKLSWQRQDDGIKRDWKNALAYCRQLRLANRSDWRLPNVKELQSIVDYGRHPPALDERFLQVSDSRAWFWSSTTHGDNVRQADYVCFGACTSSSGVDVHGAGAQRSDPKRGDPAAFGSQGGQQDEIRIENYVRCVSDLDSGTP